MVLLLVANLDAVHAEGDELICASVSVRHGARRMLYPEFEDVVADPSFRDSTGRLTNVGKHQLYLLGRELAYKYVQQSGLVGTEYKANEVVVRSSGYNRTIESAQAVLSGLYTAGLGPVLSPEQMMYVAPPIAVKDLDAIRKELREAAMPAYQRPVPVHTTNAVHDYIFSPHTECDTFKHEETKLKKDLPNFDDTYSALYANLSKELPTHKDTKWTIDKCYNLGDNVLSAIGNGVPVALTKETVVGLAKCSFNDTYNKFLVSPMKVKLLTHAILSDTMKYFAAAVARHSGAPEIVGPNMAIFQVSDVHILALHKALGWEADEVVPFAGFLVLELHMITDKFGVSSFEVRGYYNGKEMAMKDGLKYYAMFRSYVAKNTFKDDKDYMKHCLIDRSTGWDRETYFAISIVMVIACIALWGSNWFLLTRKNEEKKEEHEELVISSSTV